jgi:hypothetical protein
MSDENITNRPCPFLGLLDDPETSQGFPSIWNYCHHSQPIASPAIKHQKEFCLGGRHGECPVFLSRQASPLPTEIRAAITPVSGKRNQFLQKLVLGLTALGVILVLSWGRLGKGMLTFLGVGNSIQTSLQAAYPTATIFLNLKVDKSPPASITFSPFPTLTISAQTSTPTLYLTLVPTNTPSQLDAVIGTDYKFVIHKVLDGETLNQYAAKYNTSVQTILAVNHGITVPVWVNTLVVIPVGFTDFAELPSFVVYKVTQQDRGISVEEMAKRLKVDPADLRYYNGWTSLGARPLVGQFLLVPRYDHLLK